MSTAATKSRTEPDLTDEQSAAAQAIEDFLTSKRLGNRRYFVLHGVAGVGKSTLLAHITRDHPSALIATPTGKSAHVLRRKTGLPTSTVHSAIYLFRGLIENDDGKLQPIFADRFAGKDGLREKVMLLDEASCCGTRLADDILATGATVVACGDPGQLPPVADEQFFVEPDATLRTIHRQALESPIIRQAHSVRMTGTYRADGRGFQVASWASDDVVLGADAILCWRNATRRALNRRKRDILGLPRALLRAGEPLMCLRNSYEYGIWNGGVYALAEDYEHGMTRLKLRDEDDNRVVTVHAPTVEDIDPTFDRDLRDDRRWPFAIGYAATVHKYQGSETNRVLVIDEYVREDGRRQWLYTACTRAIDAVIIVRV